MKIKLQDQNSDIQGDENITVGKVFFKKKKTVANIEKITYQGNIGQKKVCNREKTKKEYFFT